MKIEIIDGQGGNGRKDPMTSMDVPDGKWVARVSSSAGWCPRPEDERCPKLDRPRPIMHVRYDRLLGVCADEVAFVPFFHQRDYETQDVSNTLNSWAIADHPFVVVTYDEGSPYQDEGYEHHRGFNAARQVHKGELGQRPVLQVKPRILRSEIPSPDGYWNGEEYIRPNLNWVELSELAGIVKLEPEEIIHGFASFSPSTYYAPNVPLLRGMLLQEDIVRVYVGDVPTSFCGGEVYWGGENAVSLDSLQQVIERNDGRVWVPQSFVHKVMRLLQFGYHPGNEKPERHTTFRVDPPSKPEAKLPDLPVEELRTLRMRRPEGELDKESFSRVAETVLGFQTEVRESFTSPSGVEGVEIIRLNPWQERTAMGDELNGFAYETDYEVLEAFDGRLVVSRCFWTRAGASKGVNYWAGQLSVHPRRTHDPRRDPNATLRIKFWPGELVRVTPTGSVGGLCPASVPAEMVSVVTDFLSRIGYGVDEAVAA